MAYITQDRREAIFKGTGSPNTPGELNYCFTIVTIAAQSHNVWQGISEALELIAKSYIADKGLTRSSINDVIGAFACAAMEYRRRDPRAHFPPLLLETVMHGFYAEYAAPYEDVMRISNGDISYVQ